MLKRTRSKDAMYFCSPLCGGWTRTHSTQRHRIIATLADLLAVWGEESPQSLNRRVYKATACGASISIMTPDDVWHHNGQDWTGITEIRAFTIQTIVEGSDATVDSNEFKLPVFERTVDAWIKDMEAEAASLWHEANVLDSTA